MKKVLLSILAVAAMASCVQSEDVNPQQLIDFGSPFVGGTTKAAEDPSYGEGGKELRSFNVYGTVNAGEGVVNIFDGVEVTGTVGGGVWTYGEQYKQYWFKGATYNFAAVVDAETVGQDANKMPTTLTPAKNNEGYLKDLLYAFEGSIIAEEPYSPVNFEFEHLLAKAQFVVTSTSESGYYYKVEGIKIHNFSTGTYTISTGAWATADENAEAYDLGGIAKVTAADAQGVTNTTQVLLIPTETDFKVEFMVKLCNDKGTADTADDVVLRTIDCTGANAKTVETDLVKGYAYNFNLALNSGTEIQFTVNNNPTWTDSDITL